MQMSFAPPLFVALIERLAGNARKAPMSVQVSGLADTVRAAKAAIDSAGTAASRLKNSAAAVVATIGTVNDMTAQLDAANRDLTDAVSVMTNGGPPLDATTDSAPISPAAAGDLAPGQVVADVPHAITAVQNANKPGDAFPAAPTAPSTPPAVVTASTIAAAATAQP